MYYINIIYHVNAPTRVHIVRTTNAVETVRIIIRTYASATSRDFSSIRTKGRRGAGRSPLDDRDDHDVLSLQHNGDV